MKFFVAVPAQTMQVLHVIHIVTEVLVCGVVHYQILLGSTDFALPVGVFFDLARNQHPLVCPEILLVIHTTDVRGDRFLAGASRFCDHAIATIILADVPVAKKRVNENVSCHRSG